MNIYMAFGPHTPSISTWTMDTNLASSGYIHTSTWPLVAPWTMGINVDYTGTHLTFSIDKASSSAAQTMNKILTSGIKTA